MCMAQFAKMYTSCPTSTENEVQPETIDDEIDDPMEGSSKDVQLATKKIRAKKDPKNSSNPQLFQVVCCENNCCKESKLSKSKIKKIELPQTISLNKTHSGEAKNMKRRWVPLVLRFYRPNKDKDPIRFFLHELMLYVPWGAAGQKNLLDMSDDDIMVLYVKMEDHIESVKKVIMPFYEDIQEARFWLSEAEKLNTEQIGDMLAPGKEQENLDAQLEVYEQWELEEMAAMLNPDQVEEQDEIRPRQEATMYGRIGIMDRKELCQKSRQMDKDQRRAVDISIKFFKDIIRAKRKGAKFPESPHLMVHGAAGVGKSHIINLVCQWAQIILHQPGDNLDHPYIIRSAFMGTAAAQIGGQTLTSAFGFGFNNKHTSMKDKERDIKKIQLNNLVLVIIDEISTVKSDLLYMLNLKLQEIKEMPGVPFGGIATFHFGDIFQLPPILGSYVFQKPKNPDFHMQYMLDISTFV